MHSLPPRAWLSLALCLALAACVGSESRAEGDVLAFRLPTLDGSVLGPGDFGGEVVVLDFWATWCGPCRLQEKILAELEPEYAERGVRFLGVNQGEDEGTVRQFAERHPFPYPVLLDKDQRVGDDLEVFALPTLLVIDRNGEVVYSRPGVTPEQELRAILKRAGA